jgi:hypothetical protein
MYAILPKVNGLPHSHNQRKTGAGVPMAEFIKSLVTIYARDIEQSTDFYGRILDKKLLTTPHIDATLIMRFIK